MCLVLRWMLDVFAGCAGAGLDTEAGGTTSEVRALFGGRSFAVSIWSIVVSFRVDHGHMVDIVVRLEWTMARMYEEQTTPVITFIF